MNASALDTPVPGRRLLERVGHVNEQSTWPPRRGPIAGQGCSGLKPQRKPHWGDHGDGLSTAYDHLSSIGIKLGQKLDRGQAIAQSGTTGSSTGCHLHGEVMVDSKTLDPIGWL